MRSIDYCSRDCCKKGNEVDLWQNFCGKCGSQLNEDGSCPKCNAAQNTGDNNEINKRETGGAVPNNSAPEKPVKLTHKEKKTAKR